MIDQPKFHRGGYIPAPGGTVRLDPDECLIRAADVRAGRLVCSRPSHVDRYCFGRSIATGDA